MQSLVIILGILFAHWIADFVLQSDYMAKNKSKDINVLTGHVAVYYLTLAIGTGLLFYSVYGIDLGLLGRLSIWWMVNAIAHFAVDFITSRLNSKLWAKGDTHNFFVSIGFDQFLHYACLFTTAYYILGVI